MQHSTAKRLSFSDRPGHQLEAMIGRPVKLHLTYGPPLLGSIQDLEQHDIVTFRTRSRDTLIFSAQNILVVIPLAR